MQGVLFKLSQMTSCTKPHELLNLQIKLKQMKAR